MPKAALHLTGGSLSRRMILIASGWISLLLLGGGLALDRVLTTAVTNNSDAALEYVLTQMELALMAKCG